MSAYRTPYRVSLGDTQVALIHDRSDTCIVANILDVDRGVDGTLQVWCDRRIHGPEMVIDEWTASGALVTCLTTTRPVSSSPILDETHLQV